jgi:hypothetical protein
VRAQPHHLKIEKEDTLSEALDHLFPNRKWRLWGKNGAVRRIAAMNPHIQDVNRLKPGMIFDIGEYANMSESNALTTPIAAHEKTEDKMQRSADCECEHKRAPASQLQTDTAPDSSPYIDERYGLLSIASEFSYSKISSADRRTGGTATFLSTLTPGLRASWGQHWSKSFQTAFNFGIRNESYIAPASYTLDQTSHLLSDFGPSARWVPLETLPNLGVEMRFEWRQELFARSTSLTSTSLEAVRIPELMAGVRYRILDLSPFTVTFHAHALYLFSTTTSDFSVESGTGAAYGVAITQSLSKNLQLSGDFWYFSQSQSTSIATQERTDVGLTFGITFRFDAPKNPESLKRGDLP